MDVTAIRTANLRRLIKRFQSQEKFAHYAGLNPGFVSQMLNYKTPNGRPMGHKTARALEKKFDLPDGGMDQPPAGHVDALTDAEKRIFEAMRFSMPEERMSLARIVDSIMAGALASTNFLEQLVALYAELSDNSKHALINHANILHSKEHLGPSLSNPYPTAPPVKPRPRSGKIKSY